MMLLSDAISSRVIYELMSQKYSRIRLLQSSLAYSNYENCLDSNLVIFKQ